MMGDDSQAYDFIDYQGQRIRLARRFRTYEEYKATSPNIAPDEIPRVQGLLASAPVRKTLASGREAMAEATAVKFPGYGLARYAGESDRAGATLVAFDIEIPDGQQIRTLVFRVVGEAHTLIADFLREPNRGPSLQLLLRERGGELTLTNEKGKVFFRHAAEG